MRDHVAPSAARRHVITIPGSDRAFGAHVARIEAGFARPEALERRLRRLFPLVAVRQRALSGEPAWYVYRDGRWRPPEGAWWEDPSLPRVSISSDGWVTDANRTAIGLLGMDLVTMTDHHFTDFVVPGTLDDSLSLFRVIESGEALDATMRLRPKRGRAVAIDLHAHREDGGVVGVFRLARDIPATVEDVHVAGPASVTTLPATDVAFRGYVLRALDRMSEPTPDGLDLRVRRLYPRAATSTDGDRWTATRDPDAMDGEVAAWWHDAGLARVRYDAQAFILEANPAAEALFGRELVGHHWQEFVLSGTTDEVAVMLEILAEVGAAVSRFRMPRADGGLVEFDSYTYLDGTELVTVMRALDESQAD